MAWDLQLGEVQPRTSIQAQYRGSASRGISAPARASGLDDLMLWWRPEHGAAFGYEDGWTPEGDAFYFSGLGQEGDQSFDPPYQENGRLRDHATNGDHVRLLRYVGKNMVRYLGELRLDPDDPWRWCDAPDRRGETRRVIQFRFLPVGRMVIDPRDPVHNPASRAPGSLSVEEEIARVDQLVGAITTPIEALRSPTFRHAVAAREVLARRRELELVYDFRDWLALAHGLDGVGLRIPYAPEARDLRADLFVPERRLLVEAKSNSARENIRQAIGQLFDYRRWLDPEPDTCVLVPAAPATDMLDLLERLGIGVAWRSEGGFEVMGRCLP